MYAPITLNQSVMHSTRISLAFKSSGGIEFDEFNQCACLLPICMCMDRNKRKCMGK